MVTFGLHIDLNIEISFKMQLYPVLHFPSYSDAKNLNRSGEGERNLQWRSHNNSAI